MKNEGKFRREHDACRRVGELLSWFIQGQLSDEEKVFVAGHLASCPKCVSQLRECVRVKRLVKGEVCRIPVSRVLRECERRFVSDLRRERGGDKPRGYAAWLAAARILDLFASRIPPLKPVAALVGFPLFLMDVGGELRSLAARRLRGIGALVYDSVR